MKKYIRSEKRVQIHSDEYKIISDMQTLKLKFVSKGYGSYYFSDASGNNYKYDRGTFAKSKFNAPFMASILRFDKTPS